MMSKVWLDFGHGGNDPGAIGKRSKEKDNVLKVGMRVKALLEAAGHTVKLSRSTDVFVSLGERARMANAWDADYFISLHNNAATATATGFETFIYNGSVSSATSKLQSSIHNTIAGSIGVVDRGRKRANYSVLRETNMPAVLIEYAFISNTNDENILINEVEKLAQLTAQGIINYADGQKVAAVDKKEEVNKVWVEFSSPTLKREFETFLGSKAQQEIAVQAGVDQGYMESWLTNKGAKPGDKAMLGLGATIKQNK
ncbi:N-acetylmuramoyl-L-alanine amidase family protein [Sporosarcina newyorkensis]|uniref:N-acetylmuramoyl-L-alanine amidase family protein n=1 Tax=Sporosarcina newyorkensis TaxID=759851 RepID=UPI003CFDAFF5